MRIFFLVLLCHYLGIFSRKIYFFDSTYVGIPRLVYTSTTNVVFCGQPILNGDETIPYANSADQVDMYSLTKTEAEKFVLSQDSTSLESSSALQFHTCAIRPAGIYGEGTRVYIPKLLPHHIALEIRFQFFFLFLVLFF